MAFDPDFRAFARDLVRLCRKHGIEMGAYDEGNVYLKPARKKKKGDPPAFTSFKFSPSIAVVGDESDDGREFQFSLPED